MNEHQRRRKREIGVAFLAEAIADILIESQGKGERGVTVDEVRIQLGFSKGQYAGDICKGILHQMALHGEVYTAEAVSPERWRLTRCSPPKGAL